MVGVEILSGRAIANVHMAWLWFLIALLFICIGLFLFAMFGYEGEKDGALCILALFILLCIWGICSATEGNPYVEYKVSVSSKADMTKFYKKYEVIKSDGKIYKVKMKGE
jgi:hypothetical protein